jgi:hypothetical protein
MLFESNVIDATCIKLESFGYTIEQKLTTSQHGDDIIAARSADRPRKVFVEAKGETSSRQKSERYGTPFDSAQVGVHVAEAFYKAALVLSRKMDMDLEIVSAIALPSTKSHRNW